MNKNKENEVIEEDQKKKPKLNNAIMLFAIVTAGVGIWFGSTMVSNPSCNAKAVKIVKEIKVNATTTTEKPTQKTK